MLHLLVSFPSETLPLVKGLERFQLYIVSSRFYSCPVRSVIMEERTRTVNTFLKQVSIIAAILSPFFCVGALLLLHILIGLVQGSVDFLQNKWGYSYTDSQGIQGVEKLHTVLFKTCRIDTILEIVITFPLSLIILNWGRSLEDLRVLKPGRFEMSVLLMFNLDWASKMVVI